LEVTPMPAQAARKARRLADLTRSFIRIRSVSLVVEGSENSNGWRWELQIVLEFGVTASRRFIACDKL
jgi:hypothetical protein